MQRREVIKTDEEGYVIEEYESVLHASHEEGTFPNVIRALCSSGQSDDEGNYFMYAEEADIYEEEEEEEEEEEPTEEEGVFSNNIVAYTEGVDGGLYVNRSNTVHASVDQDVVTVTIVHKGPIVIGN